MWPHERLNSAKIVYSYYYFLFDTNVCLTNLTSNHFHLDMRKFVFKTSTLQSMEQNHLKQSILMDVAYFRFEKILMLANVFSHNQINQKGKCLCLDLFAEDQVLAIKLTNKLKFKHM